MSAAAAPLTPSVVLIDGRSGSGKTTLAAEIAQELGADILPVESLYPGWDGLAAGSSSVAKALDEASYLRYDWVTGRFEEDPVRLAPQVLVIEGCGAITSANLDAARRWAERFRLTGPVRSIWLEMGERERRERALARDGETFAPHWERWAQQERAHFGAASL